MQMKIAELTFERTDGQRLPDNFAGSAMVKDNRYYLINLDSWLFDLVKEEYLLRDKEVRDALQKEYTHIEDLKYLITKIQRAVDNQTSGKFSLEIERTPKVDLILQQYHQDEYLL